jgi:hypothetical protein
MQCVCPVRSLVTTWQAKVGSTVDKLQALFILKIQLRSSMDVRYGLGKNALTALSFFAINMQ